MGVSCMLHVRCMDGLDGLDARRAPPVAAANMASQVD